MPTSVVFFRHMPSRSERTGPAPYAAGRTSRGSMKDTHASVGYGAITRPSGSNSPVSSKRTTPLHSKLQPCSGWAATARAAARSGPSRRGTGGSGDRPETRWYRNALPLPHDGPKASFLPPKLSPYVAAGDPLPGLQHDPARTADTCNTTGGSRTVHAQPGPAARAANGAGRGLAAGGRDADQRWAPARIAEGVRTGPG